MAVQIKGLVFAVCFVGFTSVDVVSAAARIDSP